MARGSSQGSASNGSTCTVSAHLPSFICGLLVGALLSTLYWKYQRNEDVISQMFAQPAARATAEAGTPQAAQSQPPTLEASASAEASTTALRASAPCPVKICPEKTCPVCPQSSQLNTAVAPSGSSDTSQLPYPNFWPVVKFQASYVMDVGFNLGGDSWNYLLEGMRVVAIEADPHLVAEAWESKYFRPFLDSGQLILLNVGIGRVDGEVLKFHINPKYPSQSAIGKCLRPPCTKIIDVTTITCETLLVKYGVPVYLKIDIEHQDHNCMASLSTKRCPHELPRFVSYEDASRKKRNLNLLRNLGYTYFKFVKQAPYSSNKEYLKINKDPLATNQTWPWMTSGPWGNFAYDGHSKYNWHDIRKMTDAQVGYDTYGAKSKLGSWCDVHAFLWWPETPSHCKDVGISR
eukprot:gnl/TRDRNA2_/TRDRNA2_195609_c0_seq1.p1 gnl/TRDRNA2_/TRDRNA2_195609_c0~~gnl/TRDRNA2_/TRDRNA2_195609_c0_seq1.p1  ORF type:complete len:405 (+),score=41.20 gnl/TRDRNA2_/TRDRNA2_195609_c0_seq1:22-1236(+)